MRNKNFLKLCTLCTFLTGIAIFRINAADEAAGQGWTPLFDGKTLSGWSAPDGGDWTMNDKGEVVGTGKNSHLFSPNTYTNIEWTTEVKLNHSGNSGMYFRAVKSQGWPEGYEAQVENTSPDPARTGSLYHFHPVKEQLVQDDTWWTQTVVAIGNHIIIKVNDKIATDVIEHKNTYSSGYLALQQHNLGSEVTYRNMKIKALPANEEAAWAIVRKDMPELAKTK